MHTALTAVIHVLLEINCTICKRELPAVFILQSDAVRLCLPSRHCSSMKDLAHVYEGKHFRWRLWYRLGTDFPLYQYQKVPLTRKLLKQEVHENIQFYWKNWSIFIIHICCLYPPALPPHCSNWIQFPSYFHAPNFCAPVMLMQSIRLVAYFATQASACWNNCWFPHACRRFYFLLH